MTPRKIAKYPFNEADTADAVILTSDGVLFYVHKTILSFASQFFRDMFGLNKPSGNFDPSAEPIAVSETSKTINYLLRMVYPVEKPALSSLTLTVDVWEASHKYQMALTEKYAQEAVRSYLSAGNELHVFAAACRMGDEELANIAASAWRDRVKLPDAGGHPYQFLDRIAAVNYAYVPGMKKLSGGVYYRLLQFLRAPRPLRSASKNSTARPATPIPTQFLEPNAPIAVPNPRKFPQLSKVTTLPTDVVLRATDGVDIPTHISALQLAGAQSLLDGPLVASDASTTLPIHSISLSYAVLHPLVNLCYPSTKHDVTTIKLSEIPPLVSAARRYQLKEHINVLKKYVVDTYMTAYPLFTYFVAEQSGWDDLAEQAGRLTAGRGFHELYTSQLDTTVSASSFNKFLRFHHKCQTEVLRVSVFKYDGRQEAERALRLAALSTLGIDSPVSSISLPAAVLHHPLLQQISQKNLGKVSETSFNRLVHDTREMNENLREALNNVSIYIVCA